MDVGDNNNCTVIPPSSTSEESAAVDTDILIHRPFAENVLGCAITIGEKEAKRLKKLKKEKKKKEKDEEEEEIPDCIVKYACALYNAGGGVLELPIANFEDLDARPHSDLDTFWQTVEPKLKALIKPYSYTDVFDRIYDGYSGIVRLFIKRMPNHFCTLDYNLSLPGDSGIYNTSYTEAINVLSKKHSNVQKVPICNLPKLDKEFTFRENVGSPESKQIQFKHYTSEKILDGRQPCETIRKTISAFANANGGAIVLGVTDKGVVEGQNLEGVNSKEAIVERVKSLIDKMEWSKVNPKQKEHWDIEFFPLKDKEKHSVIVITVAAVLGGVFAKCPESVELRPGEDGSEQCVHHLSIKEWIERMTSSRDYQDRFEGSKKALAKYMQLKSIMSRRLPLLTIEGSVEEIQAAFFEVKDDWPVSPTGAVSNLPKEAQHVIRQIQVMLAQGSSRGLLLLSRSWLRNVDPQAARPDGLICDLLLVSQDFGGLHLFTLCEPGSEENVTQYSLTTARNLKKSLVLEGGCEEKFYISNSVDSCSATTKIDSPCANKQYPKPYDMAYFPEKLNKILEALVIVLAKVPSMLSNSMGVSFLNLLTVEQFQLVHEQIEHHRELWVNGPAGSGKTLVAVEFMRELRRRDQHLKKHEILYVCENKGLREQVWRADVCACVCRKSFMKYGYPWVKHVVMDEVQSFSAEDGDWLEKAKSLVRAPCDAPEKAPGFLWLFIDNSQVYHSYATGIPAEKPHNFLLKKVIRNSKTIFEYSKKYINVDAASKIELGHDFPGEKVMVGKFDLKNVLKYLFNEGYSEGEIAVLYGEEVFIPDDLRSELNLSRIDDAERNNSDYLVVSTLRKYSGLERPVVVLVNLSTTLPYGSLLKNSIYCAVTRAMVKLVIIDLAR